MDRRNFFIAALGKSGKTVVNVIDDRVNKQALHWIRPPYAINELEFILACTRCRACIEACPYQVIFSLSAKTGAKFVGTPALDLLNKGCHLCDDWPCVNVCEVNALSLTEPAMKAPVDDEGTAASSATDDDIKNVQTLTPKLAKVTIDKQSCLPYSGPECGACFNSCPIPGALMIDMFKPVINQQLCSGCGLCRENCIVDPKAILISSL